MENSLLFGLAGPKLKFLKGIFSTNRAKIQQCGS
jgi:hypothetical protein